jgi:outer membrane immunogenic protein
MKRLMKRICWVIIHGLGFLGAQAYAADMSQPVYATKAPVMVAPVVGTWQGFYIGLDGGYGWGGTSIDPLVTTTGLVGVPVQPFANPSPSGFLFGGHGGYNWQYGNVVGGLEVDYLGADMTSSQTIPIGPVGAGVSATLGTKVDALASGRAKLGYALNDIILLYGTGGVAWGHESATATLAAPRASISETTAADQFGWVAGAGAEMKLMTNILLRAQFLHYDFGDVAYTFPISFGGVTGANAKTTVNSITGGISYKF